jgi:DNA-binding winged helix-turn-helix (wHTH) protein
MAHVLVVDIDDATLAAIEELVHGRAQVPALVQFKLDGQKVPHLGSNGAAPNPMSSVAAAPPTINTPDELVTKDTFQPTSDIEPRASKINGFSSPPVESRTLVFACWRLDLARHELRTANDAPVPLSHAEFELLYVFAKHPHRWLTRRQILDFMKGHARPLRIRSIDVYVSRLRRKLEVDMRSPKILQTVRNGYKLSAAVTIR